MKTGPDQMASAKQALLAQVVLNCRKELLAGRCAWQGEQLSKTRSLAVDTALTMTQTRRDQRQPIWKAKLLDKAAGQDTTRHRPDQRELA